MACSASLVLPFRDHQRLHSSCHESSRMYDKIGARAVATTVEPAQKVTPRKRSRARAQLPRTFLAHVSALGLVGLALRRFLRACMRPLRSSFRINRLKATPDVLLHLRDIRWAPMALPWCEDGFLVDLAPGLSSMGGSRPHLAGEIYGQEPTSMLPVLALRAAVSSEQISAQRVPSDLQVLDLCAAPGSKSTQLAAWIDHGSFLVANEPQPQRARILRMNLLQAGVSNFALVNLDGRDVGALASAAFDAVLVDAPCSAEGNMRKHKEVFERLQAQEDSGGRPPDALLALQRDLLASGWKALRPGGCLVYSTCTLNSYENEAQCRWLLDAAGGAASVVDLGPLLGLPCTQVSAEGFVRVWPQAFDTEGFFVSCFKKEDVQSGSEVGRVRTASTKILVPPDLLPMTPETQAVCVHEAENLFGFWPTEISTLAEDANGTIWSLPRAGPGVEQLCAQVASPGIRIAERRTVAESKAADADGIADTCEPRKQTEQFEFSDELMLLIGDRGQNARLQIRSEDWVAVLARVGGGVGELTALLDVYAERGDVAKAEALLAQMASSQMRPEQTTYATLIKAYTNANDLHKTERVMAELRMSRLPPDICIYNALLTAFAGSSQSKKTIQMFDELVQRRLQPGLITYNSLLKAWATIGGPAKAARMLKQMEGDAVLPDVASYTTLIDAHARKGKIEEAENLFAEMLRRRLIPDTVSYKALIKAYAKSGKPALAKEAVQEMFADGLQLDNAVFTSLIDAYAREGDVAAAEEALAEMEGHRLKPDLASFNSLTKAYARDGDVAGAERVLTRMQNRGLRLDLFSYNTLLKVYVRSGDMVGAEALLNQMQYRNHPPDVVSFGTLLNAHAKKGAVHEVQRVLEAMQTQRVQPDGMSYDALVKAYAVSGDKEGAQSVLQHMREMRLAADGAAQHQGRRPR